MPNEDVYVDSEVIRKNRIINTYEQVGIVLI